jgi:hypothetical protein
LLFIFIYTIQPVPQTAGIFEKYIQGQAKKYGKYSENISEIGCKMRQNHADLYADMWRN